MYDELTEVDIQKMQEELNHRIQVLRPQLIEEVQTARAFGDLSENFEYRCAKQAKNRNESRIRYLEGMIRTAKVIDTRSGANSVGLFDWVTVYNELAKKEMVLRVVTTLRQDALKGLISKESPAGKALLGHSVGDRVQVEAGPTTKYFLEIRAIKKGRMTRPWISAAIKIGRDSYAFGLSRPCFFPFTGCSPLPTAQGPPDSAAPMLPLSRNSCCTWPAIRISSPRRSVRGHRAEQGSPMLLFHGRRFCSDFPTVRISCGEALFLRKSGKNKAQIVRQPPMVWICRQICGTAIDPAIDCLPPGHTDGRPTEHTSPQTN